jgi:cytochrome c biogenesis protein CcmG/thiol:disulfide interchange protein DsbE
MRAVCVSVVLAALLIGCSSNSKTVKAASLRANKDRKLAPDFALKDVNGHTVKLSDYRGKVVLLDFWATWCGPCQIEIPWFKEFEQQNKDRGFAVIGVAMDEEGWEVVKPFAQHIGINYRLVIGNDSIARQYGGVDALPTTFLIDRDGRIASIHIGLSGKRDFENGIQELLQAPNNVAGSSSVPAVLVRAE